MPIPNWNLKEVKNKTVEQLLEKCFTDIVNDKGIEKQFKDYCKN